MVGGAEKKIYKPAAAASNQSVVNELITDIENED